MSEFKQVTIILRDGWEMNVVTTNVLWKCPTCGEKMGEPSGHNFYEDGDSHWCNVWTNPCGHNAPYKNLKMQKEDGTLVTWEEIKEAKRQKAKDRQKTQ